MVLKILLFFIMLGFFRPTKTKQIKGDNAISELSYVDVNGAAHCLLIRSYNKDNPIILFVHGGPCNSDIPFITQYQKQLEKHFTIIHYDQRGCGKSYNCFQSYQDLNAQLLVDDLLVLSEMIKQKYKQKIILLGHSYGTYLGLQAAQKRPDLYRAYIGVGQVADSLTNEKAILDYLLVQANQPSEKRYLRKIKPQIKKGKRLAPRLYVHKYKGAARKINITAKMIQGHLFSLEYNFKDSFKLLIGIIKNQNKLERAEAEFPLPTLVPSIEIPMYF
ncbi:MAG TPA: alpha/beta hydrolase, partial [Erysipelothrix sp.]